MVEKKKLLMIFWGLLSPKIIFCFSLLLTTYITRRTTPKLQNPTKALWPLDQIGPFSESEAHLENNRHSQLTKTLKIISVLWGFWNFHFHLMNLWRCLSEPEHRPGLVFYFAGTLDLYFSVKSLVLIPQHPHFPEESPLTPPPSP